MIQMLKGYIYRHWIINDKGIEKSYIGQTINDVNVRWQDGRGYTTNYTRFARAIRKYGWDNFNHEVLHIVEGETVDELKLILNALEVSCIEEYDSFKNGYNSTTGGESSYSLNEESIAKMCHKVVCLNTGEVFDSMVKTEEWWLKESGDKAPIGLVGAISGCCLNRIKRAFKHPSTGENLVWAYYEDYVEMTQEDINNKLLNGTKDAYYASIGMDMDSLADTQVYINEREFDSETIDSLEQIYKFLSPSQTYAFKEYYIQGYTLQEIAERHNVSKTMINKLVKQAINKIRERYTYESFLNLIK